MTGINLKYTPKTYEQFVLEEKQKQNKFVAENYQADFYTYNNISTPRGYGPSPENYYSDSSGNYVRVTVSADIRAERAKKAGAWKSGFAEGCCYDYDLDDGLDPHRYVNKDGEGGSWIAHKFEENIGYANQVNEGRTTVRRYTRTFLKAIRDSKPEFLYPVEPKNPYED